MKAKVISVVHGRVYVVVNRRPGRPQELYKLHDDLRVGDVIDVDHQVNNPYLVRVASLKRR